MRAFECDRCPLAFEIGSWVYWDLTGNCQQVVCTACGTMHRLEEKHGRCRVLALPGPIRQLLRVKKVDPSGHEYEDYEWPYSPEDWQQVGHASDINDFERLTCSHCGALGRLVSLEWPRGSNGLWPIFGEQCPLCSGPLPWLYDMTIQLSITATNASLQLTCLASRKRKRRQNVRRLRFRLVRIC